ncbi:MAG: ArsR/SmtB family transcription factor [Hyphomicrobiaceae bacterium]
MKTYSTFELMSLLSNQTRFALLAGLADIYPAPGTPSTLAGIAGVAPGTARRQLHNLCEAGLVESQRSGRTLRFRLNATAMSGFLDGVDARLAPAKERAERQKARRTRASTQPYESLIARLDTVGRRMRKPGASLTKRLATMKPVETVRFPDRNILGASLKHLTERWQSIQRLD